MRPDGVLAMYEKHPSEDCPVEDRLLDYHLGEMSRSDSLMIDGHLRACEHCRMFSLEFDSLNSAFASIRADIDAIPIRQGSFTQKKGVLSGFVESIRSYALHPISATALAVIAVVTLGLVMITSENDDSEIASAGTPGILATSSPSVVEEGGPNPSTPSENNVEQDPDPNSVDSSKEIRLAYVEPISDDGVRLTDLLSELE